MENIIIPLVFFMIPIVAIITKHLEKIKRMELEKKEKSNVDDSLIKRIEALEESVVNLTHENSSLSEKVDFNERLISSLAETSASSGKKRVESLKRELEMEE
jgi:predicted RNase H-like nuclease (RuvC/YqgF family)